MRVTDVISQEECQEIAKKAFALAPANTTCKITISCGGGASSEFARNETRMATENGGSSVGLRLTAEDRRGSADGVRFDDEGLKKLMAAADAASRQWHGPANAPYPPRGKTDFKAPPKLFFDSSLPLMTPEGRGQLVAQALDATDAAGVIGAGSVSLGRLSFAVANNVGLFGYTRNTAGSFSMTARTKDGTGSGWAWTGHEDWSKVDIPKTIATAIDLAQRSRNPVAVEPGRYTVVLEPAAVAPLIEMINWDAWSADMGQSVFSKKPRGTNKIGLQMMDRRLNMVADPWDPDCPRPTLNGDGDPLDKVQYFKDGILRNLIYSVYYAKEKERDPVMGPENIRLYTEGPTQTKDEMISSIKRGIWVNRLSNIAAMNIGTNLLTGTTRDGTFLIENGKITKPIKNLRFTESLFFILNRLDAIGVPVRASSKAVAPRIKVRDFNFTSLTDAI